MILLLDNYKQSIPIMKSLYLQQIPYIVGSSINYDPICYSRYCQKTWKHPEFSDQKAFLHALNQFLQEHQEVDAIFPIGELGLKVLAENKESLLRPVKLLMPSKENIMLCLDKKRCSQFISELDIPCPRSYLLHSKSELQSNADKNGYPIIVKPNFTVNALRTEKAIIINNRDEIAYVENEWDESAALLMEDYICGDRISVNLVVEQGEVITYLENQAQYTQELDGTGYTVRTISKQPTPILQDYVARIVQKMNYNGVMNMQFIYRYSNQCYYFMEINPRMPATTAFIYKMGIDVSAYTLHINAYKTYAAFKKQIINREGILCNWFYGDLVAFTKHLFKGKLNFRRAVFSFLDLFKYVLVSDVDQLWSNTDPKPALLSFLRPFIIRVKKNR